MAAPKAKKKPAARRAGAKKTTAAKATARRRTAAKPKTAAKRAAPKRAAAKKAAPKRAAAKKAAPARKTAARKAAPKRAAPKRAAAKRAAPARKMAAKKAAPKRAAAKRAPAKKAAARPAKPQTATQQFTLLSRLVARALAARLAPKGIGYGQFPVLQCLWDEDGVTQKELSQRVRIEAPTMVRTLDRMEREGLVKRQRSNTDRRQIHIKLTAKGGNLKKDLVPLAGQVNTLALGGISGADRSSLDKIMGKLIGNLERDAGGR